MRRHERLVHGSARFGSALLGSALLGTARRKHRFVYCCVIAGACFDVTVLAWRKYATVFSSVSPGKSLYRPWRPLGLREVETSTFLDIRLTDGGKVVSPTRRPNKIYEKGIYIYIYICLLCYAVSILDGIASNSRMDGE
jgi:hypothetical protein